MAKTKDVNHFKNLKVDRDVGLDFQIDETGIGTLVFDLPGEKINKLSQDVFIGLHDLIDSLKKNKNIKALIITSGKKDIFIAGADIAEIACVTDPDEAERMAGAAQFVFHKLEDLPFPTIAAIHGACLGGGMELALACDYRIISDDDKTQLGLPEVNLGIIPGAGGTQRLPRIVGLQAGLEMIVSGKPVKADKAKRIGLADKVVHKENLQEKALEFAKGVGERGNKKSASLNWKKEFQEFFNAKKVTQKASHFLLEDTPVGRHLVFKKTREMVLKKSGGHYPAPLKAIEAVQASLGNAKKGYAKEAQIFGQLAVTQISKNLIQIFYASEEIKKDPGVQGAQALKINRTGVLGAGLMGGGIAQLFSQKDVRVRLKDIDLNALGKGLKEARSIFQERVNRRRMTRRELENKMAFITPTLEYTGFKHLDLVVEAVIENMELKQRVLKEAEAVIPKHCIFASNTSSLSITELARASSRPERVIGMHFFNPVWRMPLVEVIPGEKTGDEAIATIVALSKQLGKVPVIVGDGPGFLVNRLLGIYLNEAAHLFEEGAEIEEIDRALVKFGMPMGPFRLLDEVGLQTASKVAKILYEGLGKRLMAPSVLDTVIADGRSGKSSGRGFYLYDESMKTGETVQRGGKEVDRSVYDLWPSKKRKTIKEKEMVERLIFSMVNEATRCLDEKIARSTRDIDMALIMGTGFPPFHGGLIRYANHLGLAKIVERLKVYEERYGTRFKPHEKLVSLAKENKTL